MKTILQISKFITPPYGGVENHVESICDNLKTFKPHLLSSIRSNSSSQKPYDVTIAKSYGKFLSVEISPSILFKGNDLIKSQKIDLVHGHLPNPWANCLINFNKKTPNIITWHSDVIRQKLSKYIYNFLQKKTLQKVDKIIMPSKSHYFSSSFLQNLNIQNKIVYIPIGIDVEDLEKPEFVSQAFINAIKKITLNKKIILTVGRHVYYKGYEYLIRSMKKINDESILLMIGEGTLTTKFKKLIAELELNKKIILINNLKRSELKYLYNLCDIFTLPSIELTEAFGIVSGEAMVFKKPTVVCDLKNGVNELNINEYNSLFCEKKSIEDLAEKINYLLDNSTFAKKLGCNGHEHVKKNYDFKKTILETESVYQSLL